MRKSLAAIAAVVSVVPLGKVSVTVEPDVSGRRGVKRVKSESLAWTNVPTTDPEDP